MANTKEEMVKEPIKKQAEEGNKKPEKKKK